MAVTADEPAEVEVVVPSDANAVVIDVGEHTWVALVQGGVEVVREHSGAAEITFTAPPGAYTVRSDGRIDRVRPQTVDVPAEPMLADPEAVLLLRLTADAPDQHVIDGVGEIPADGESWCTVTVEKIDATGRPRHRRRDTDDVFLRTTGGTIMDARGAERIRSLKLRAGRGSFRLVSEPAPRLVTVSALGSGSPAPVELPIEFV